MQQAIHVDADQLAPRSRPPPVKAEHSRAYDRVMASFRRRLAGLLALTCCLGAASLARAVQAPPAPVATPAPSQVVTELQSAIERARQRFEARDLAGVLAAVSERYRSSGMTKAALREQLLAMFALYQELRARVAVERVEMVDGGAWVYTSGEVTGRLPLMGWVTVLAWQGEPEVARREAAGWRLIGFQD
jgi:hypothetical protein